MDEYEFPESAGAQMDWPLPAGAVKLTYDGWTWKIAQQPKSHDLLSRLVHLYYPNVSLYALDIIFRFGFRSQDTQDAQIAYSAKPLQQPPKTYMDRFRQIEWPASGDKAELYPIILAGSSLPQDRALLLHILDVIDSCYRSGALYAISTFNDQECVERVARCAMTTDLGYLSTGEMPALITCFRRWIERQQISPESLYVLLKSHEQKDEKYLRAEWVANWIHCDNWRDLPFPEATADFRRPAAH